MQRLEEFKRGVGAIEKQVAELCKEAERLVAQYPDTRDHVEVRRLEMEEQLKDVVNTGRQRELKLQQALRLQSYFQVLNSKILEALCLYCQCVFILQLLPTSAIAGLSRVNGLDQTYGG